MTSKSWSMSATTKIGGRSPVPSAEAGPAAGARTPADIIARGIALHNQRKFREAEYCYQLVLRDDPGNTDALNLMGLLAIEADRYSIALDFLRKAVKGNPKVAIYQNNLGNALLLSAKPDEAIPHLKKAVSLEPGYTDAICNLGRAYRSLGDAAKTEKYYQQALDSEPGFARARAGLAELAVETGKLAEAETAFRSILQDDPENIEALWGLAIARKFSADDPEIAVMETLAARPDLKNDQRAPLLHGIGKIYNDIGRYDDAIASFVRGKQFKGMKFHMDLHRRTYAQLRETFTKAFFAGRPGIGNSDERPVFIVGMPRTGTTLTEQILASHRQIHGLGELPDMRHIGRTLKYADPDPKTFATNVSKLTNKSVQELAKKYLRTMDRAPADSLRATDKNPHNYEMLGLIALLFPRAHIIHCRRDPMDTCVSCFMQNFNDSHGYNSALSMLGEYYREYSRLMDHWREVLPVPMFELNYEDMVNDQEAMSRKLIEFLGLEWDDACLSYFDTDRTVSTPSRWQVRQPIYTSSVRRWKRYEHHLGPLKQALGDLFIEHGP